MELHHQLFLAQTKKKELRKELRAFENEFLAKHKRYKHTQLYLLNNKINVFLTTDLFRKMTKKQCINNILIIE